MDPILKDRRGVRLVINMIGRCAEYLDYGTRLVFIPHQKLTERYVQLLRDLANGSIVHMYPDLSEYTVHSAPALFALLTGSRSALIELIKYKDLDRFADLVGLSSDHIMKIGGFWYEIPGITCHTSDCWNKDKLWVETSGTRDPDLRNVHESAYYMTSLIDTSVSDNFNANSMAPTLAFTVINEASGLKESMGLISIKDAVNVQPRTLVSHNWLEDDSENDMEDGDENNI